MFQHTAARRRLPSFIKDRLKPICFNTQPPEGGCRNPREHLEELRGFNTQPPEGGCTKTSVDFNITLEFQHTAARRRLRGFILLTHLCKFSFNTQPPEGGCLCISWLSPNNLQFQHTAARRRLRQLLYLPLLP